MVAGVLQKYPAGHGDVEIDEAGHHVPGSHAIETLAFSQ